MSDDDSSAMETLVIGSGDILVIRVPASITNTELDALVHRLRDGHRDLDGRIIVVSHEFQLAKVSRGNL